MSTSTTTFSNISLGIHGFTFNATTPSGRRFLLSVVHAPVAIRESANLVIGELPSPSCFFAHVVELTPGSENVPSAYWVYEDNHVLISHLDTL